VDNNKKKLFIYNTLSGSKELFKPIFDDKVLMYVCGITAYDFSHIGHGRAYITFDIIYRYLKHIGYEVVYVRNFTDIDDKIIKRANDERTDFYNISERFIKEYNQDMESLGVAYPTYQPKATETIPDMIKLIKSLIDKDFAYEKNGDVFFRVNSFKGYGKLSQKNINELLAGARIPVNEEKENLLDFALWKKSKQNEPFWDSPWGQGRPGWHIECSAMSMKFLGGQIDIHGGGSDLIFPHHENEIAQTESYTGKKFVNYWIHNGFVNINNEKMSKSLKNFITIRDLLKEYHPEIIRLFFMFTHYRSFIYFSESGMESAKQSLIRLYQALDLYNDFKVKVKNNVIKVMPEAEFKTGHDIQIENIANKNMDLDLIFENFKNEFYKAMNDDFNTAEALSVIFNIVRKMNQLINQSLANGLTDMKRIAFLDNLFSFVMPVSEILGIMKEKPGTFLNNFLKDVSKISLSEEEIKNYIEERNEYRQNKEYKLADDIRKMLYEKGVELEDTNFGTKFKIINNIS
jgi:cysteinyl-tRNA synthetase